jgi:hypothetical protein
MAVSIKRLKTREKHRGGRTRRTRNSLTWEHPYKDKTILADRTIWQSQCGFYKVVLSEIRSDQPEQKPYLDKDGNVAVRRNTGRYGPVYYAILKVNDSELILDRCLSHKKAVDACDFHK